MHAQRSKELPRVHGHFKKWEPHVPLGITHSKNYIVRICETEIVHDLNQVSGAIAFWNYVDNTWMKKLDTWVTDNRNIPHPGQDTNAVNKSYHSNMNAVVKPGEGLWRDC